MTANKDRMRKAQEKLDRALFYWYRNWGHIRFDAYGAPWDKRLANAYTAWLKAQDK
jgi:hypothetical protein